MIKREPCALQPQEAAPQLQSQILIDCGFNNKSTCYWKKDTNVSKFDWAIKSPSDSTPAEGPDKGALSSNGYIYAKTMFSLPGI